MNGHNTGSRLSEFVPGQIWLADYPIRYGGTRFNARMTVVRLDRDRLFIHSPCEIDAALKAAISHLGRVAFIVAPGNFHYFYVSTAQEAFPEAETFICPGVEGKRPDLPYDDLLGDSPEPGWAAELDQVLVEARIMREVAFFHRASRTLILVDLVENFGDSTPGTNWMLRLWFKGVLRMWNRARPAPEYPLGWGNRARVRRSLERILQWDFDRVVLAHGDLIVENAKQVVADAWRRPLAA